jgi:hypothetical protein
MKKVFLISVALIIFIIQNNSYGFISQRYEWWKIRLKDLNVEKEKLLKNKNIYEPIINLINNDIKRAKKILTIFDSNGSDELSKNYEKKKYTDPEIQESVRAIATPLFSLKYLDFLINNIGKKDLNELTERCVNIFFTYNTYNKISQSENKIIKVISSDSFSKNDWKYLSMELFLEITISNKDKLYNQSLSEIQNIVFNKLPKTDYFYEPDELKEIIITAVNEVLMNLNIAGNLDVSGINTTSSAYWYEKRKQGASDPQELGSQDLLETIKLRFARNVFYANQVALLAEHCSELKKLNSTSATKRFQSLAVKIFNLLNTISHSLTIDQDMINRLRESELLELNKSRIEIAVSIKKANSYINEIYTTYAREQDKKRIKFNDTQSNLREIIAECEMDLFLSSIREHVKEFTNMNYNYNALLSYSQKYTELQEEVSDSRTSKSLEYAIKKDTIIPLLKDFNVTKIKREHETRKYLTNIILRDIARLETLATIYKREGVKVKYTARNDLNAIKENLRSKVEVKIAGWIMTDTNFEKVDKKAVQKLNIGINKNIWKKKDPKNPIAEINENIKINNINIGYAVPKGWVQQNLSEYELEKGILRCYKSVDGKALIYLAGIASGCMDEKDAAELWIKKMKNRKVMNVWGKKNKTDYFWTLSNNSKNEIMEAYTISCGDKIFVLAGISSKEKYNLFKEKITSVFDSISL